MHYAPYFHYFVEIYLFCQLAEKGDLMADYSSTSISRFLVVFLRATTAGMTAFMLMDYIPLFGTSVDWGIAIITVCAVGVGLALMDSKRNTSKSNL